MMLVIVIGEAVGYAVGGMWVVLVVCGQGVCQVGTDGGDWEDETMAD